MELDEIWLLVLVSIIVDVNCKVYCVSCQEHGIFDLYSERLKLPLPAKHFPTNVIS